MAKKNAREKLDHAFDLIREAFDEAGQDAVNQFISGLQARTSASNAGVTRTSATKAKDGRSTAWPKKGTMEYKQRVNKLNASKGNDLGYPDIKDLFGKYGPPEGYKARTAKKATKKSK